MKQNEKLIAIQAQEDIIRDREARLSSTDYIAAKIAEGKAAKTEYKAKIDERQTWRDEINAAQEEIARLNAIEPEGDVNDDAR